MMYDVLSIRDWLDDAFHLALGLGIAFKLIPVVFIPLALARQWTRPNRRLLRACFSIALPSVVSFGLMTLAGGYRFDKMFEYHGRRGIQIESIPASIEMILMAFGMEGHVYDGYGCDNLSTPYARVLTTAATVMLGLMVLGSASIAGRRIADRQTHVLLFSAVLSGALVFSKVLSPQYFLFLLPVLVTLPLPRKRWAAAGTWMLIAVVFALTGVIFPCDYSALQRLDPLAQVFVITRNACLILLSASLFYRAWHNFAGIPARESASANLFTAGPHTARTRAAAQVFPAAGRPD
jgi:hypothetical protein